MGLTHAFTSSKCRGNSITGIVCGPCDDPASVFRIEDGRILAADRAVFFIRYDTGGPAFPRYGPYRERVDASTARNRLNLAARPEETLTPPSRRRRSRAW